MKITNYALNITREDVAAFYELKSKHEHRKANVTISLIMFSIFALLPFICTRTFIDFIFGSGTENWMLLLDIIIVQELVIVILAICLTGNAYRCGKLFRTLRKNNDLSSMMRYIAGLGEDSTQFRLAAIIHSGQYLHSYITSENMLVIAYNDCGIEDYYTTCEFEMLCDEGCESPVLIVSMNGIRIVDASKER